MLTKTLSEVLLHRRVVLSAVIFLATVVFAEDPSARARLFGSWQAKDPAMDAAGVWTIESKGDAMRVTHSMGDKKLVDFECNIMGRECESKGSGKRTKISMWFSGSKLVTLETSGKEIVKRRFAVADQEDTLELEVIPILPTGKSETVHFQRVQR